MRSRPEGMAVEALGDDFDRIASFLDAALDLVII